MSVREHVGVWPQAARWMISIVAVNAEKANKRGPEPLLCDCGRVHMSWYQGSKSGAPSCDPKKVMEVAMKRAQENAKRAPKHLREALLKRGYEDGQTISLDTGTGTEVFKIAPEVES